MRRPGDRSVRGVVVVVVVVVVEPANRDARAPQLLSLALSFRPRRWCRWWRDVLRKESASERSWGVGGVEVCGVEERGALRFSLSGAMVRNGRRAVSSGGTHQHDDVVEPATRS